MSFLKVPFADLTELSDFFLYLNLTTPFFSIFLNFVDYAPERSSSISVSAAMSSNIWSKSSIYIIYSI